MRFHIIYPKPNIVYTNMLSVTAGCRNCSFDYVSSLFKKYVSKYYNVVSNVEYSMSLSTRLVIADLWYVLENINALSVPSKAVLWLDTAWVWSNRTVPSNARNYLVLTTSQWNADILTKLGIDNAIVPRAIDDDYAVKYFNKIVVNNNDDDSVIDKKHGDGDSEVDGKFNVSGDSSDVTSNVVTTNVIGDVTDNKKYDVVAIMTGSSDGHKNEQLLLKILDALHLRKTSFLVCALPQCDAKPFSLTDDEKYELLSQSRLFAWLSESEGFGLPPVEAMSVGTPVVHFDSIYVNTPLVNAPIHFPLSVHGFKKRESPTVHGKYFASPVYDFDEIVSEFKDALSVATSLTVKDRIALHEYVMRNYSHKVILPELKKYMGGSF